MMKTLPIINKYPFPAFIIWRDHVGKPHYSEKGVHPKSVILSGYTQIIHQTEEDVVVAQFAASDGGMIDQIAIDKQCIIDIHPLVDTSIKYVLEDAENI